MKYGVDRALANVIYQAARVLMCVSERLSGRSARVGLVVFHWGKPWRRWRVVPRTSATVPWVELGPLDVIFQDNYPGGYQ